MKTPPKIRIHVEGGLVQSVYSDWSALDIAVIDIDELRESHTRAERDEYLISQTLPLNEIAFAFNPNAPVAAAND